jgi:hypothetical protein
MENVTALVRSIFHKESLDDCSLEELQAMARQYFYFTPVQLLLAEKLRTTDENLYREQLQKLSLHFNNPLWLDYLLNSYKTEEPAAQATAEIPGTEEDAIEKPKENGSSDAPLVTEEQGIPEPIIDEVETNPSTEGLQQFKDEFFVSSEENKKRLEQIPGSNTDVETENPGPMEETDKAPISIPPLPDMNEQPAETELTFQPYHTVDYFASQGIKFIPEEKPVDRFGRQLKSFTEWLKTMKRLPQSEMPKITDIASEKKVEQMAEHSIDQGEVITETMAEVWIKQGNKEKAIETYNKLSLLNPDKSAYFASLAEQLKNS